MEKDTRVHSMRILNIRLENFNGIKHGLDTDIFEYDLSGISKPIVQLVGKNGSGKSTIMNSLHPFSHLGNTSTYSLISKDSDGIKEIVIESNGCIYTIRHVYMHTKDTITMKSYLSKDGIELNINGNVTSFKSLILSELSYAPKYSILTNLSNINIGFIDMSYIDRKTTINSIVMESNEYESINKDISSQLSAYRKMIKQLHIDIDKLNVSDDDMLDVDNTKFRLRIDKKHKEIESIKFKLYPLQSNRVDIAKLRYEMDSLKNDLKSIGGKYASMNELILDIESKTLHMNEYTKSYNLLNEEINRLSTSITTMYAEKSELLQRSITTSEIVTRLKAKVEEYDKLNESYLQYLAKDRPISLEALNEALSMLSEVDYIVSPIIDSPKSLINKLKDLITNNNRDKVIKSMKFSNIISSSQLVNEYLTKLFPVMYMGDRGTYDGISLYDWYDEFQSLVNMNPKHHTEIESDQITSLLHLSDIYMHILSLLTHVIELVKPIGINVCIYFENLLETFKTKIEYTFQREQFSKYAQDLISNRNTMDVILQRMNVLRNEIDKLKSHNDVESYEEMNKRIATLSEDIDRDSKIMTTKVTMRSKVSVDIDTLKDDIESLEEMKKIYVAKDEISNNINVLHMKITECEKNESEIMRLEESIRHLSQDLSQDEANFVDLVSRKTMYASLTKTLNEYLVTFKELTYIYEATGIKHGIPMLTMKRYLENTNNLANSFLDISHHGNLRLMPFRVDESEFSIPFVKNGFYIDDVKYASSGEKVFISNALNFAFLMSSPSKYRILCFDEIDAALDSNRKVDFFETLCTQLRMLESSQAFIITHNQLFEDPSITHQIVLS